jgi:hypothetical protein
MRLAPQTVCCLCSLNDGQIVADADLDKTVIQSDLVMSDRIERPVSTTDGWTSASGSGEENRPALFHEQRQRPWARL